MSDMRTWEVILYVYGPITVRDRILTTQQKGFQVEDPFYSDIEIQRQPSGLRATLTARAPDPEVAHNVALFFFGRMVDALTLATSRPMYLSLTGRERNPIQYHDVRLIIEGHQFERAFRDAHRLGRSAPTFLRSLGWYRKGLTTENPLDKFLAFWNAIEIVVSKYFKSTIFNNQELKKKSFLSEDQWNAGGIKDKVYACFEALWGASHDWPFIHDDQGWIRESYDVRLDVAHGRVIIDVDAVTRINARVPIIEKVCYRFLNDWQKKFIDIDSQSPGVLIEQNVQDLPPEV